MTRSIKRILKSVGAVFLFLCSLLCLYIVAIKPEQINWRGGLSYSYARRLIAQGEIPLIHALQLENWELGFVLLGVTGLINRMVRGIVEGFVSINLNDLASRLNLSPQKGFWISWLIALLILLATLFVINERISKSE
jgi:hypothetical protein